MKRILIILLMASMLFTTNVYALSIVDIKQDDSFLKNKDVSGDLAYLKSITDLYSKKYVVTNEKFIDTTLIDSFYNKFSMPITLDEIDKGMVNIDTAKIGNTEYQNNLKQFKILSGLSGVKCEFEPIAFYRIYRDIVLVGGYVNYTKTHKDSYEAYWQYICNVENMTKEIVPYETRIKLVDKFKRLYEFIDNDNAFKIFILKSDKIDSCFERGD